MWFGVHLLVLVLVALGVGLKLTFTAVWSYIIVIVALLCAPFWFNPFTWDWDRNRVSGAKASELTHALHKTVTRDECNKGKCAGVSTH